MIEQKFTSQGQEEAPRVLDPRLEGKFRLKGILPGKIFFKHQEYDFRKMTVETAKQLVELKCPQIEAISADNADAAKIPATVGNQMPQERRNRR